MAWLLLWTSGAERALHGLGSQLAPHRGVQQAPTAESHTRVPLASASALLCLKYAIRYMCNFEK